MNTTNETTATPPETFCIDSEVRANRYARKPVTTEEAGRAEETPMDYGR